MILFTYRVLKYFFCLMRIWQREAKHSPPWAVTSQPRHPCLSTAVVRARGFCSYKLRPDQSLCACCFWNWNLPWHDREYRFPSQILKGPNFYVLSNILLIIIHIFYASFSLVLSSKETHPLFSVWHPLLLLLTFRNIYYIIISFTIILICM